MRCHRSYLTPDAVAVYDCPSRSRPNLVHHPVVDLHTGGVDCNCESYNMKHCIRARKEGVRVDIGTARFHCPHINAAISDCIQRGEIKIVIPLFDDTKEFELWPTRLMPQA